jgi:hypothetical protein
MVVAVRCRGVLQRSIDCRSTLQQHHGARMHNVWTVIPSCVQRDLTAQASCTDNCDAGLWPVVALVRGATVSFACCRHHTSAVQSASISSRPRRAAPRSSHRVSRGTKALAAGVRTSSHLIPSHPIPSHTKPIPTVTHEHLGNTRQSYTTPNAEHRELHSLLPSAAQPLRLTHES